MTDGPGDCFAVAAGFVTSGYIQAAAAASRRPVVLGDRSPYRIVHGTPVGQGGDVAEIRFWHAWVELATDAGLYVVLDYSNNREGRFPRAMYYRVGQLTEDHVIRYTPAQVKANYRRWGHSGPWLPDDEIRRRGVIDESVKKLQGSA